MSFKKICLKHILKNIKSLPCSPGTIIASPSTSDPDYYYHWTRDAALTVLCLVRLLSNQEFENEHQEIYDNVLSYIFHEIDLVRNYPSDLGEPKFYVNGKPYDKPWGRPQNDGPPIRGYALTEFAFYQLKKGNPQFINKNLINFDEYEGILLKDYEFIKHNFDKNSFDLWEEVLGKHYFTLEMTYQFLKNLKKLCNIYQENILVNEISMYLIKTKELLNEFYQKYWFSSIDIQNDHQRQWIDFANILAFNYSNINYNPFLNSHIGPTVLKIVRENKEKFGLIEGIIPFGRYKEDVYYQGPPWILLTIGFAQFLKRLQKVSLIINLDSWYHELLSEIGEDYHNKLEKFIEKFYIKNNNLSESFDKNLTDISAKHLTWSYSSYLFYSLE